MSSLPSHLQQVVASSTVPEISVVVPVYNEVESLRILHDKLTAVMRRLTTAWEIIYVDDGSTDGSTPLLQAIQQEDAHVIVAVQRRNFGKSPALEVGFALARGRKVVTIDADLQDEPDEIPKLLARLDEGFDLVTAWRERRNDRPTKRFVSWVANRATRLLIGVELHDINCGLKAYRIQSIRRLHLYGDMHRYIPIVAALAGFRVAEVPVTHHRRQFGRSKYGYGRLYRGGLDFITVIFLNRYQRRPLHLLGGLGALFFIVGFLIALALTIQWFQGMRPLSERPLLTLAVLLMLMGVQIFMTGLFAELMVSNNASNSNPLDTVFEIYQPPSDVAPPDSPRTFSLME